MRVADAMASLGGGGITGSLITESHWPDRPIALQWLCTWSPSFSEDIVKQMPEEGEKFSSVDSTWREIMSTHRKHQLSFLLHRMSAG
jgi:hypothetical protein